MTEQPEESLDIEALQVEVRQVEAIEEDQRIGTGTVEMLRQIGDRAKRVPELHRDGDRDVSLHISHEVHVHLLDLASRQLGIGGNVVDVQLERVRAGLLDLPGVGDPAARRDAVEAADDRDAHGCLGPPDVFEVSVGPKVVARHVREVRERLGIGIGAV